MKLIHILICLFFSLSILANPNDELLLGIDLLEHGKFDETKEILKPLSEKGDGSANYYLGL
jgi:hypothetical protein